MNIIPRITLAEAIIRCRHIKGFKEFIEMHHGCFFDKSGSWRNSEYDVIVCSYSHLPIGERSLAITIDRNFNRVDRFNVIL